MSMIFQMKQKEFMISMSSKKLKQLEKEYAYAIQHADLTERAIELKADIDYLKKKKRLK